MKKRYIIPEELNYSSASTYGFECNNSEEILEFARYFQSIGCAFKVSELCIEPGGELIPLKRSTDSRNGYQYIMLEITENLL